MALMTLKRLPTEQELEAFEVGIEGFYEAFQAHLVEGFTARVKDLGDSVDLDGYRIRKSDWFTVTP